MFVRGLLFAAWALVGAVAGYGWLYLLTPCGLVVMGIALCLALGLPARGGSRWPESLGLAAGRALCARG